MNQSWECRASWGTDRSWGCSNTLATRWKWTPLRIWSQECSGSEENCAAGLVSLSFLASLIKSMKHVLRQTRSTTIESGLRRSSCLRIGLVPLDKELKVSMVCYLCWFKMYHMSMDVFLRCAWKEGRRVPHAHPEGDPKAWVPFYKLIIRYNKVYMCSHDKISYLFSMHSFQLEGWRALRSWRGQAVIQCRGHGCAECMRFRRAKAMERVFEGLQFRNRMGRNAFLTYILKLCGFHTCFSMNRSRWKMFHRISCKEGF